MTINKQEDTQQERFFSLNKDGSKKTPFGLMFKEKMAETTNTFGGSKVAHPSPSQTPRGPDTTVDWGIDF